MEALLENIILETATDGINHKFIANQTNGAFNFLPGVKGFENILFNIEVNEPFKIQDGKLMMAYNGTVFDT